MNVRLVVTGRSYHAAEPLPLELSLPEGSTLSDALSRVRELLGADASLPDSCLVAVSGTHLGTLAQHNPHTLRDGDELVLISPVAGG